MHLKLEQFIGFLESNLYLVVDDTIREAVLIDAGGGADEVVRRLEQAGLKLNAILLTHAHVDHVLAVDQIREATGAPAYLHPDDLPVLEAMQERGREFLGIELPPPPSVDKFYKDGDEFPIGDASFRIIHTPGHSPGGICLYEPEGKILFSGDTLFWRSVGRTDLGGSWEDLVRSIRDKLFELPDEIVVYPGHGPETSIGEERRTNPFVGEGNEF
ncbi:MAG: MBL fold metallo-hydrolase [Candidatus Bipolaricaulia bacterium]